MSDDPKGDARTLVIQNIMRDEGGRSFMMEQLQYTMVFTNAFDQDPNKHSYNAGLREAGLRLNQELRDAAPGDYLKMIKENIDG
jgi:hypothetical protein